MIDFRNYPQIISVVQFGSSISGDTYDGSDVDILIIVKNKRSKEEVEKSIRKRLGWGHQIHIYSKNEFLKSIKKRDPLGLSIVHTGKVLLNNMFINALKKYEPTDKTVKKCMLNSFAALGLGISDLMHGMCWDSVNSIYHAARSSIWATLMKKEVTPCNKRILELLKDNKIKKNYKEIIDFRRNIPNCEMELDMDKKMWKKGNVNDFTDFLKKSSSIVKKNYYITFNKSFIDLFGLLRILRKNYKTPDFYSVMLSVNWEKMFPYYLITLSYGKKVVCLTVDAHNGKIIKIGHKRPTPH